MPFRHGFAKTACVVAQLTALLLLQGYFLMPALLNLARPAVADKTCYGNHRLCGCPPGRIADKTCCCFRTSHACCHNEDAVSPAGGDADDGAASLRNAPCGLFTDSGMLSLENHEFLMASSLPGKDVPAASGCFLPFPETLDDRLVDPPDPPPHILIHV